VWIFNIVGAADLLLAMVLGPLLVRDPGDFGLSYIIPTVYVPLLLVAHFYAFKVLSRRSREDSQAVTFPSARRDGELTARPIRQA
jgi:hypothetical protein